MTWDDAIAGESLQNLDLWSVLIAFEQVGIFTCYDTGTDILCSNAFSLYGLIIPWSYQINGKGW